MTGEITYRSAEEKDFENIISLCNRRFGNGYTDKEELLNWLKFKEMFPVAVCNNEIAGFVSFCREDEKKLAEFLRLDEEYIKTASKNKPVIHFESAILNEKFEGRGIMTHLIENAVKAAKEKGYGAIFASAWKYNNSVPIASVMEKCGFEIIGERKNIWYEQEGYTCIICNGRCKCDAVIYKKEL